MKNDKVISATLDALREIKDIDFSNKRMRPCFAIFHDEKNNIHKIFNHSTARQQNKYMYMNPGALKVGLREYISYNVYEVKKTEWGYEDRKYLSKQQIDDVMKYLIDNKIIEIVFPLENDIQ